MGIVSLELVITGHQTIILIIDHESFTNRIDCRAQKLFALINRNQGITQMHLLTLQHFIVAVFLPPELDEQARAEKTQDQNRE